MSETLRNSLLEKLLQFKRGKSIEELYNWTQGVEGSKIIDELWRTMAILTDISNIKKGTTGIYKITSPSEKVYIGQAKCIRLRWNKYKSNLAKGQVRLHNSFNKYRVEKHRFEIIELCTQDNLSTQERYWQEYYNVLGEDGLNCELVSTNKDKRVLTEESRAKMSEKLRNRVPSKKTLEKLAICRVEYGKYRTNKVKDILREVILKWDVETQGKVTTRKIQQLNIIGKNSVDKYYKENRDLVAEVNKKYYIYKKLKV